MSTARKLLGGKEVAGLIGRFEIAEKRRIERLILGRLAVQQENVIAQFDGVALQTDDTLDQTFAIVRGVKDDHITAMRIVPLCQVPGGERDFEIVSELVDEDAVAFDNGGLHGAGGNIVPIGERRADGEHNEGED